jgi:hypothetical protein
MASKASSQVLTDHDEIRRWAEERDAKPSAVRNTGDDSDIGMIRLDFPGYSGGDSLEEVSWDEWFEKFEESGLALVVQQETANGQRSNFNKLVSRDSVTESSSRESSSSRKSSGRSSGRQASQKISVRSGNGSRSSSSSRSSNRKPTSSGSRTEHASKETKNSSRSSSSRGGQSSRQGKSSRRKAA